MQEQHQPSEDLSKATLGRNLLFWDVHDSTISIHHGFKVATSLRLTSASLTQRNVLSEVYCFIHLEERTQDFPSVAIYSKQALPNAEKTKLVLEHVIVGVELQPFLDAVLRTDPSKGYTDITATQRDTLGQAGFKKMFTRTTLDLG